MRSSRASLRACTWMLGLLLLGQAGCGDGSTGTSDPESETVSGVDADANGVRDDVERYIDLTYPDAPTRNALRQYGKAAQSTIIHAGDPTLSITYAAERFRAIECLMARRPNDFPTVFSDVRSRILNTTARTQAYLQADGQVAAATPSLLPASQWWSACTS